MALLDSPSAAGACQFALHAGEVTSAEIDVCIYPRTERKKLGIAALTSMYLMGENRTRFVPDFRPEVHDSDGLLIQTGDQRQWRPLVNPERKHTITRFSAPPGTRFGLLQRDRKYQSYEDLVARYEKRPTFWVEPLEEWEQGTIELVEIPTPNEYNDNIVAYWVPGTKPAPGTEMRYRYRLSSLNRIPETQLLEVDATRITPAADGKPPRFVIDFKGTSLSGAGAKGALKTRHSMQPGEIKNIGIQRNDVTGGWRVTFDLAGADKARAELRLTLESEGQPVSETWVYSYAPPGN
jgi:glucans biosynthesis protein